MDGRQNVKKSESHLCKKIKLKLRIALVGADKKYVTDIILLLFFWKYWLLANSFSTNSRSQMHNAPLVHVVHLLQ